MTGFLALLLLLAPAAGREPVGVDPERIADPLERRVACLRAGPPVLRGIATVVLLHARTPEEANVPAPAWADNGLRAHLLVEDGRTYLRVANPRQDPVLVAAGTVFGDGATEIAAERDAIIPGGFAALVPAATLQVVGSAGDLAPLGLLRPATIGALLAGPPSFETAITFSRRARGEERYLPVLADATVRARRDRFASLLAPVFRGSGGTAVGAVFLIGDRPVAAHVFASHDLLGAALPDLLLAFAVEIRDEEVLRSAAARRRLPPALARRRAVEWLRAVARTRAGWSESCGAGSETFVVDANVPAIGHVVADAKCWIVHAGFHALSPEPVVPVSEPPTGPERPGETPVGIPGARPTEQERRRAELVPDRPQPGQAPEDGLAALGALAESPR